MEPRKSVSLARRLRAASTEAEKMLWSRLRNRRLLGWKIRRQFAISGYVADFACLELGLIVEVDGGQHAERVEQDTARSAVLAKSGFRVLRFWNTDVLQKLDDVMTEILRQLPAPLSPQPSPASGRGS